MGYPGWTNDRKYEDTSIAKAKDSRILLEELGIL